MSLPVEAKNIAVGDWSSNYGTVVGIIVHKKNKDEIIGYDFEFFNGSKLTNVAPDYQLNIVQDGSDIVHNGMPDPSQIRPGLEADHAHD